MTATRISPIAAPPDTSKPTVSITSPAGGTVSGAITVTAGASDNVGVAGVQFLLDGASLGTEDLAAPFVIAWDTSTAANGSHVLSARARDAAGNQATATHVAVTVSNAAPPPPSGLVAAYAFEEGVGTSAADATGKLHTGAVSGATWITAGMYGKALSFDGVNDWVTVADANDLDLTNGMTLPEAWVRPAALTGWKTVVMKEGTTTTLAYSLYRERRQSEACNHGANRQCRSLRSRPVGGALEHLDPPGGDVQQRHAAAVHEQRPGRQPRADRKHPQVEQSAAHRRERGLGGVLQRRDR